MKDAKRLNALLWLVNAALVVAIGWFAVTHLLKQQRYLRDFQPDAGGDVTASNTPRTLSDASLRISNPVENKIIETGKPPPNDFKAKLQGVLQGDKTGVAFLRATGRNVEVVAYLGEPIMHDGQEFDDFRGWKLTKVGKDRATFTGPGGKTAELTLDLSSATPAAGPSVPGRPGAGPRSNKAGQAYAPDQFKSRLLASAESRQVWGIDPEEVDWAAQNADKIMDSDFQVSPNAGGGVRLENVTPGTIAAARGLMAGDVVRDVNGQPLNSIQDLRTMLNNPGFRQQTGMRITVERGGRPVVLEYRPLPR